MKSMQKKIEVQNMTKPKNYRTLWKGRFFIWSPDGLINIGFIYKGQEYVVWSQKVSRTRFGRISYGINSPYMRCFENHKISIVDRDLIDGEIKG